MYPTLYSMARRFYPGGQETHRHLEELERTQWLSFEQLRVMQFAKLQQVVKHAYEHVPYYRELYKRLDIHPEDIKTGADFERLPFLTREDVNNNLDALISTDARGRVQLDSTGGSTGQPMHFFVDKAFHWWDAALEFRGRGWYGVREGDKIAWVWGAQRDMHTWGWKARLKARLQQNRYLNAFDMTETKMQQFAEMLVRWQPAMFRAYASALALLADYIQAHHIRGITPKLIETTAEKVTGPQRELLERVFQCKVADWYTAREMGTIGFQCPAGGLHICETRYLEVIANNRVVPPGELGEVAITSLTQYAMPFIRYKIGDMAIAEAGMCECQRGLPWLREVVGRLQDFLVTTDGHFVHGGYFPHTFRQWSQIARYQVFQPDKNHLEVRLVCRRNGDLDWLDEVRAELHTRFGADMQISLQLVDDIKLTPAGKHRVIISKVKPQFV